MGGSVSSCKDGADVVANVLDSRSAGREFYSHRMATAHTHQIFHQYCRDTVKKGKDISCTYV